jgi:hypothetical protein
MESTNNNTTFVSTDNNTNTNTNTNPRKPNLPPKFQKYLAFAFFFSNLLNDNNLLLHNNLDNALSIFYAFDSIDSQSSFFHSFELQFKPLLKSFKLLLKEREKANKPKKTKKTNKKNTASATTDEELVNNEETAEHTEKPKKQRKSKKNTEVTTICETPTNNEETSEPKEKPKKPRKSKKTIVSETPATNEETSETTEKPKKQRKSKKEKTQNTPETEQKSDLIHELLTLANSEQDEV